MLQIEDVLRDRGSRYAVSGGPVQGRAGGRDWYALTTGAGFRLDVAVFVSSACDAAYRPRLWP